MGKMTVVGMWPGIFILILGLSEGTRMREAEANVGFGMELGPGTCHTPRPASFPPALHPLLEYLSECEMSIPTHGQGSGFSFKFLLFLGALV